MANFLTRLFSKTAGSLVEAVGDAIDKNFTTDEERKELENEMAKAAMQYELEMTTLCVEETKAYLADLDSARDNQSRVQESEYASWLSKNVHSILSLGIVILTFATFFAILVGLVDLKPNSPMKDMTIYILGALTTISTQVVASFFGSSQGSKDKQKSLHQIAMTPTPKQ